MTSIPVNESVPFLVNGTKSQTGSKETIAGGFNQVMSQTQTGIKQDEKLPAGQERTDAKQPSQSQADRMNRADKHREKLSADTEQKPDAESKVNGDAEITEEVNEEVTEAVQEAVSKIAEELGVSEEEVLAAMEALGISLLDLTNQGTMAQLVTALTGQEDPLALVTDADLFATVTKLTEMVSDITGDLAQELQLTENELKAVFDALAGGNGNQEETVQQDFSLRNNIQTEEPEVTVTGTVVSPETEENVSADEQETAEQVTKGQVTEEGTAETGNTNQTELTGSGLREEESNAGTGNEQNQNQANQGMANTFRMNYSNVIAEIAPEMEFAQQTVDVNRILNQIADYVKINAKPEITQMEIQLNPANLGNINIQVEAKEGVVTAQITADNEAVRQALEAQVFRLKESLDAQGIKVDAVEVTIASHEFERNLDQNNGDAEAEYQAAVDKASRRRINLNMGEISEEDWENLSQEEQLQIDMMERSGNSLDYKV